MHSIADQSLSAAQVTTLTRAMLSVALVDGIQTAEAALIRQFYEASRTDDMATTDSVMASLELAPFALSELNGSAREFAETLMPMCLMTAYADGRLSTAELDHLKAIAAAVQIDGQQFDAHLAQVRDELVGALSHLPDAGSVAVVVKELAQIG